MNMRGLLLLFTIAILGACSPHIFRKPIYSTTTYKGERGSKKVTKRNQAKADRERDMVEALETAEESRETLIAQKKAAAASDSLNQEKLLDAKIAQLLLKTEQIITELNTVSPYSSKGHEKALKLSTELNDLIYNQINPLSQVISSSKEIVRLGSEITFETGSATLTADGKQKISLGRGLVRSDVNVIMFDEPLTVIDPHLKWVLRSKLKELHQKINRTMIYVTHDQIEALTFADQVVVMHEGQIVQTGTPVELFEKPKHTFVGHFIGSPGMNILPCEIKNGQINFEGKILPNNNSIKKTNFSKTQVGIRPEFINFSNDGIKVKIKRVSDTGRHKVIDTECSSGSIKILANASAEIPSDSAYITFDQKYTYVYGDDWIIE